MKKKHVNFAILFRTISTPKPVGATRKAAKWKIVFPFQSVQAITKVGSLQKKLN